MAVDLKSTVRKDLRVRILRPPLKYSLEFVSLGFEDPFPSPKEQFGVCKFEVWRKNL